MLNENIKVIRKSKGLSQQDLANKLNVVRQTVSKWEQGLSVPDSSMLISLAEAFDTSISSLLGETIVESKVDDLNLISEKLEAINLQFSQRKIKRKRILHWFLISLCIVIITIFLVLFLLESPYLNWDYSNIETAILGVEFHSFEWMFVRVAPVILIIALIGFFLIWKKNKPHT
ncbi:helix-turn-helix domain-containing protein [Anaerorhabdus sp.]|uniref:helix-turn-helix domain-containing protein n=1 Tax=Anaerorhabdus sp. TaxID=1872524 RepID=UPI002FCC5D6C